MAISEACLPYVLPFVLHHPIRKAVCMAAKLTSVKPCCGFLAPSTIKSLVMLGRLRETCCSRTCCADSNVTCSGQAAEGAQPVIMSLHFRRSVLKLLVSGSSDAVFELAWSDRNAIAIFRCAAPLAFVTAASLLCCMPAASAAFTQLLSRFTRMECILMISSSRWSDIASTPSSAVATRFTNCCTVSLAMFRARRRAEQRKVGTNKMILWTGERMKGERATTKGTCKRIR